MYLELMNHLLSHVMATLTPPPSSAVSVELDNRSFSGLKSADISIAQSALLCIDALVGRFGGTEEWADQTAVALEQFVDLNKRIHGWSLRQWQSGDGDSESMNGGGSDSAVYVKMLELAGSLLLCCGTICNSIKVGAVPFLSVSTYVSVVKCSMTIYGI